jgi:phage baseplate assembly protein gpV
VTTTLYDTIRRIVADEVAARYTAELAVVQETHPHADASDRDNHACTVVLRDSGIVLERVPVATPRTGVVAIPAVDDLVLVQFVGGSVDAPVIVGSLHSDAQRPPPNREGQALWHLPAGAADADAAHLELTSGDERSLTVRLGSGLTVHLRDGDPAVDIDVGGRASVRIGSDGTLALESQGELSLTGTSISIEAQAGLTLKGATVDIN